MSWDKLKIAELCSKVKTCNPSDVFKNSKFYYFDISSVDSTTKSIERVNTVCGNNAPSRARQLLKKNDILVSTVRPNLNAIAKIPNHYDGSIASTGFCVLRTKEDCIYNGYLFYWLQSEYFINSMIAQATGASYPAVSDEIIKNSLVPLPPLHVQKQIADILDKADALRNKDQQLLQKYDELAQAIFFDMFGDPVKNEKGWKITKLGEQLTVDCKAVDPTPLISYNYIGLEHIQKESGKILSIDNGKVVSNKFLFSTEHILYGKLRPYLNKVATPDFVGICSTDIFPLKPNCPIAKCFLVSILRSKHFVEYANSSAVGANLPRANKDVILRYFTISPNKEILETYAKRIRNTELQKLKIQNSICESESLFQSLLQQAFKGELIK